MRNRIVPAVIVPFFLALGIGGLQAQAPTPGAPDENPTANTGALKAQIETGGSYDAHSGNITRSVTDLRVPGALGVYGLDFTRHWNSVRNDRYENLYSSPAPEPEQPNYFGSPGWSHSWSWIATYDEYLQELGGDGGEQVYTMAITITFPDGHASKYTITRSNRVHGSLSADPRFGPPYYASRGEANWNSSGEIHDFLGDMAADGSNFWLYLADGGSVHFVQNTNWGYQATTVLDPHGLRTDLHYNGEGNLDTVTQEGGRQLTIRWDSYCVTGQCWTTKVIGRVESAGSGGTQAVEYSYSWLGDSLTLTAVLYQNDPVPGQFNKSSIPTKATPRLPGSSIPVRGLRRPMIRVFRGR